MTEMSLPPDIGFLIGERRRFQMAFLLCCAAGLWIIWSVKYPPMVDVPQHAVQISVLKNYSDPSYGFGSQFHIHWFSPYVFAYLAAGFFALFFSVLTSMKIVVSISMLLFPISLVYLIRELEGDRWWALAGVPIFFGFSFIWGLFNFLLAISIGIFCIARTIRFSIRPSIKNGVIMSLLLLFSFFCHGIVFGMCFIITGLILLSFPAPFVSFFQKMLPLFISGCIVVIWYLLPQSSAPGFDSYIEWAQFGWHRIKEIPVLLFSIQFDFEASRSCNALLIAILIGVGGLRKKLRYYLPLVASLLLYNFGPHHAFGHSLIYTRLAIFVFICALLPLKATQSPKRLMASHALIVVVILFWLSILSSRFKGFDQDARDFDLLISKMEKNKSVMALTYDRGSKSIPGEVFYHFVAWYQVEKGGAIGYSIAYLYNVIAQYKPGRELLPLDKAGAIWSNPTFMNWQDFGGFDYYVVRSVTDKPLSYFQESPERVKLVVKKGNWKLYQQIRT